MKNPAHEQKVSCDAQLLRFDKDDTEDFQQSIINILFIRQVLFKMFHVEQYILIKPG